MAGRSGELVVKKDVTLGAVPLQEVAARLRTVPPDHVLIRAARSIGTSFGD